MQKRLMKFLRSMTFGMILLGLILLCSFPGSVIAQGNTPDWYVQTYPDWHGVILKLGLDDVFGSWYFITLIIVKRVINVDKIVFYTQPVFLSF